MLGFRSRCRGVWFEEPSAVILQARVCEGGGPPRHGDPKSGTKPETADTDKVTLPRCAPSSTRSDGPSRRYCTPELQGLAVGFQLRMRGEINASSVVTFNNLETAVETNGRDGRRAEARYMPNRNFVFAHT